MIIYENMVQELLQVEMTVETWFKDIQIYQIAWIVSLQYVPCLQSDFAIIETTLPCFIFLAFFINGATPTLHLIAMTQDPTHGQTSRHNAGHH